MATARQRIELYDTTLRDGTQGQSVSLSLNDKLLIAAKLDELGVDYIEGGYPLSNAKDSAFFEQVKSLKLRHARVAAFGMTRRKGIRPEQDEGMIALLSAQTEVVTIVGKTWDLHAREVLGVSLEENLAMIADSVRYCAKHGREVIYDAEHFFDGYAANPEYALRTLLARCRSGSRSTSPPSARMSPSRWASTRTTTAGWPWPTGWPPSRPGPRTPRAPSTASASAAATWT
jgi:2-isopropylmalate synthase